MCWYCCCWRCGGGGGYEDEDEVHDDDDDDIAVYFEYCRREQGQVLAVLVASHLLLPRRESNGFWSTFPLEEFWKLAAGVSQKVSI